MKNKLLYLVILLLSYNTTISQTLHLQDQQTLEPIPFANISTKQLKNSRLSFISCMVKQKQARELQ